ncbi:hypothetical protein [Nocardia arthritidis]|uniref:hypothetical protein n=1 Tax=Nocardia arthritidis TaxID=228602 RepID=UPI0007A40A24|nr:hypothetical protein [Nocardia arthritidis]
MSTESERRPYSVETEGESATTGGTRAESQYDRSGEAERRHEAGTVGESAATRPDAEQAANPDLIDEAGRARTTAVASEPNRPGPVAQEAESVRGNASAGQHATDAEHAEFGDDAERGSIGTAEQAAARDSGTGSGVTPTAAPAAEGQTAPLFADADLDRLRTQWREAQVTFVDNPSDAVARADALLSNIIDHITATYQQRKRELDERRGDTSDTEGLRQALRGYRAFFDQLLSIGG